MGIDLNAVHLMVKNIAPRDLKSGKDVLTLGVKDCYFSYTELKAFYERNGFAFKDVPEEEHEFAEGFFQFADYDRWKIAGNMHQRTLFQVLGFDKRRIKALDINDFEGADIIHDLNEAVPEDLYEKFDVIFEGGTIEHVFSLKDAFFNLARMCRTGGIIIHFSPVDMINHGFVNFNYTIYTDFYNKNGFECEILKYIGIPIDKNDMKKHYLCIDPTVLHAPLPIDYIIEVFGVVRKKEGRPLKVPIQSYYQNLFDNVKDRPKKPPAKAKSDPEMVPVTVDISKVVGIVRRRKNRIAAAVSKNENESLRPMPKFERIDI